MTHGERIAKKARGLQLFGCSDETCSLCNEVGQTWVSLIDSDPVLAALEKGLEKIIEYSESALTCDLPSTESMDIEGAFEQIRDEANAALAPTKT